MSEQRPEEVVRALDALYEAIESNRRDEQILLERISNLRLARASGEDVTTALQREPGPGTMELLGSVLGRLMDASGKTRRALARSMRAEGTTIPAIARVFGVTHQRVSNILSRPDAAAPQVAASFGASAAPAAQGSPNSANPSEGLEARA